MVVIYQPTKYQYSFLSLKVYNSQKSIHFQDTTKFEKIDSYIPVQIDKYIKNKGECLINS